MMLLIKNGFRSPISKKRFRCGETPTTPLSLGRFRIFSPNQLKRPPRSFSKIGSLAPFFITLFISYSLHAQETIRVGSKKFTESYILAEIMAQKIERELKIPVERKFGLGGTLVCVEALRTGEIDIYPEYSGTAVEVLLKSDQNLNLEELTQALKKRFGFVWLQNFGFNNSYALAMKEEEAKEQNIQKYSDLLRHPDLKFGFSHEFLNRRDGWGSLKNFYEIKPHQAPVGMEHTLAYEAIQNENIDVMDVYTTDAKVFTQRLRVLEDDKKFFPHYFGAPIVRAQVLQQYPRLEEILNSLGGKISDETMRRLNTQAEEEKKSFEEVAQNFLQVEAKEGSGGAWLVMVRQTLQHLKLTFLSVLLAALLGIPLGILMRKIPVLANPILYVAGIVQTIPSIALLALMIPLFGIGEVPALVALFIYGLLPIVRNSYIGLKGIPSNILEAADGLGLRPMKKLRFVELPLALPMILGGVKTSAVINVGTATLAAFIGAGGLGEPIVTGLALNDTTLILRGAIPAALLAIFVEGSLSLFERKVSWKKN